MECREGHPLRHGVKNDQTDWNECKTMMGSEVKEQSAIRSVGHQLIMYVQKHFRRQDLGLQTHLVSQLTLSAVTTAFSLKGQGDPLSIGKFVIVGGSHFNKVFRLSMPFKYMSRWS